jgi:hypothetical protein
MTFVPIHDMFLQLTSHSIQKSWADWQQMCGLIKKSCYFASISTEKSLCESKQR